MFGPDLGRMLVGRTSKVVRNSARKYSFRPGNNIVGHGFSPGGPRKPAKPCGMALGGLSGPPEPGSNKLKTYTFCWARPGGPAIQILRGCCGCEDCRAHSGPPTLGRCPKPRFVLWSRSSPHKNPLFSQFVFGTAPQLHCSGAY